MASKILDLSIRLSTSQYLFFFPFFPFLEMRHTTKQSKYMVIWDKDDNIRYVIIVMAIDKKIVQELN
jgi:hypothetical protein